jgi:farnesyl diphosphate synthase
VTEIGAVHDDLLTRLRDTADEITLVLDQLLPRADGPEARLFSAMRYAALGGGKRLRPFLLIEAGRMFEAEERGLLRAGAAVECAHIYSLIHDDLPAMDDDALRHGKPTVHLAYDEATAILAGDGLQAMGFTILADADTHSDPALRVQLIELFAAAIGPRGMVGGQIIDMRAREFDMDEAMIARMQRMKTGALLSFSLECGALLGGARRDEAGLLAKYAHDIGLAYQITDDLLDLNADPDKLGKTTCKDKGQDKATFVSIMGETAAAAQAKRLIEQAKSHLDAFGHRATLLRQVADFILHRDY